MPKYFEERNIDFKEKIFPGCARQEYINISFTWSMKCLARCEHPGIVATNSAVCSTVHWVNEFSAHGPTSGNSFLCCCQQTADGSLTGVVNMDGMNTLWCIPCKRRLELSVAANYSNLHLAMIKKLCLLKFIYRNFFALTNPKFRVSDSPIDIYL